MLESVKLIPTVAVPPIEILLAVKVSETVKLVAATPE